MGVTDGVVLNPGPGVFGHLLHLHTGRVVAQLTTFSFCVDSSLSKNGTKGKPEKRVSITWFPPRAMILLWRVCHTLDSDCYLFSFVHLFGLGRG